MASEIPENHVIVQFGKSIPADVQARAMMAFERNLREWSGNYEIDVFREAKGDDSKLRAKMTVEQRAKL